MQEGTAAVVPRWTGLHPVTGQTGFQLAVAGQTGFQLAVAGQTGFQLAVAGQTGFQLPVAGQTGFQLPVAGQTGFQLPVVGQTGFQLPVVGSHLEKVGLRPAVAGRKLGVHGTQQQSEGFQGQKPGAERKRRRSWTALKLKRRGKTVSLRMLWPLAY